MHELSIMSNVVNSLQKLADDNNIKQIRSVTLEIGKMRAAVPELLKEGFIQLQENTVFDGAELIIEEIDVDLECRNCGRHIEAEDSLLRGCPDCGSIKIKLLKGNELNIKSFTGI